MNTFIAYLSIVTLTLHCRFTTKLPTGKEYTGLSTCTAVYITPNEALTAGHCIEGTTIGHKWARTSDGKSFRVKVLWRDFARDLALLYVSGPPHKYVILADNPQKSDKVYVLSSEEGFIGSYNEGIVSNIIADPDLNMTAMIVHTAAIRHGASGSGLFNSKGALVGINTKTMGPLSEAVDAVTIRLFLEEYLHYLEIQPK